MGTFRSAKEAVWASRGAPVVFVYIFLLLALLEEIDPHGRDFYSMFFLMVLLGIGFVTSWCCHWTWSSAGLPVAVIVWGVG